MATFAEKMEWLKNNATSTDISPGIMEILGMSIPADSAVTGVMDSIPSAGQVMEQSFLDNVMSREPDSAFAEKLNWLKENPAATEEQKQLIGVTPTLESEFNNLLNSLPAPDRSVVMERMGGMTPQGRMEYMQHVIQNGFSYGTINEGTSTGELTPGYGDTSSIQNLGFSSNQLASNDYYNQDLGIFLPASYESGYTAGSSGDERYRQNYMRDKKQKYKYPYRYGMGGPVQKLDFT